MQDDPQRGTLYAKTYKRTSWHARFYFEQDTGLQSKTYTLRRWRQNTLLTNVTYVDCSHVAQANRLTLRSPHVCKRPYKRQAYSLWVWDSMLLINRKVPLVVAKIPSCLCDRSHLKAVYVREQR
jgi:hypothetical protein